jgi:hypothetical protein
MAKMPPIISVRASDTFHIYLRFYIDNSDYVTSPTRRAWRAAFASKRYSSIRFGRVPSQNRPKPDHCGTTAESRTSTYSRHLTIHVRKR